MEYGGLLSMPSCVPCLSCLGNCCLPLCGSKVTQTRQLALKESQERREEAERGESGSLTGPAVHCHFVELTLRSNARLLRLVSKSSS